MIIKVISKLPAKAALGEIYQSMDLKLALTKPTDKSDTFERITPFVKCRDFLCDVYTFSAAKLDFSIYGMSFKGSQEQPARDGLYLLAKFPDKTAKARFLDHLDILLDIEARNNVKNRTTVDDTDEELQSLIIADKRWLQNCLSFSMYTYLLRAFCYEFNKKGDWIKEFGSQKTSDSAYMKSVDPETWGKVFNDLSVLETEEFCGFEVTSGNVGTIHHNSGFISVFGSHTEINPASVKNNKHWQVMKERGLKLYIK